MFVSSLISSKVALVAQSGSHFASGAHTAVWQLLPQLLPPLQLVKTKPWTPSAATSWSFHFCWWWNAATSTFLSATLTSSFATTTSTTTTTTAASTAATSATGETLPPRLLSSLQFCHQAGLPPLPPLLFKRCQLDYCFSATFKLGQQLLPLWTTGATSQVCLQYLCFSTISN